jgi:heat shock protein HslJ
MPAWSQVIAKVLQTDNKEKETMRNKLFIAALMTIALIVTACGGGQTPTSAPTNPPAPTTPPTQPPEPPAPAQPQATGTDTLGGTSWTLATLNGQPALKDATVTLNFVADKVAGSDGCNRYNTSYTADGTNVTFKQPIATTMMACPGPIMTQAQAYLQALGQVATYKNDGQQLSLSDASGKELATFAMQSSDLGGTAWVATGYNNGKQAVVSVALGTEITANFGADGQLTGSAGCNTYVASYETSGKDGIKIGPGATTMKMCEPAVMDQEQQYLAALQTAATYRIDGSKLELRTADGALAVTFQTAAAAQPPAPAPSSETGLQPSQIKLDTQGLPYAWQAVAVPATPYDASQPPGPKGLPEHIEILFGAATPAERQPGTPIMYIIPVDAYRQLWDSNGNPAVSSEIAKIYSRTVAIPSPIPTSGWPALPPEEVVGYNDLAVQVGRASSDDLSASKSGFRLVGRWAQSPNPVTNQGLRYVYQGFTNDGQYLVTFFYPVTTKQLPNTVAELSAADQAQFAADPQAAIQKKADELNTLSPAWDPDLTKLNALVGSLQIEGMKPAGLLDQTWTWVGTEAIGGALQPLADPRVYEVLFKADGTVEYKIDCNSGSGTFTYEGGLLGNLRTTLGPSTLAECNDAGQGQQLVNGLKAAQNYKVRPGGTTFELVLPAGGGSLVFEAK